MKAWKKPALIVVDRKFGAQSVLTACKCNWCHVSSAPSYWYYGCDDFSGSCFDCNATATS